MDSLISKKDIITILQNYLGRNDMSLVSYHFESISEDVEGFMGEHNKLIIIYQVDNVQKTKKFFVKNKPIKSQAQADMTEELGMYKREIFLYQFLLKEFEKYEFDVSFAAKSYLTIPEKLLVMEDLSQQGYSVIDRGSNLTMRQLKCVLKSLSLYHAAGYAYQRTKAKELNKEYILDNEHRELDEFLFIQYIDKSKLGMKWWESVDKTLDAIIPLLPKDDDYKQEFKKLLAEAEFSKVFVHEKSINKTSCHGDLWSNNMLFKEENDVSINCCLVDFQATRYCFPSFDVILAIFSNTSSEFRDENLQSLYSYYHNTLTDVLKRYGYDVEEIYPLNDFHRSLNLVKPEAMWQILLVNTIVHLPKNNLNTQMTEKGDEGIMKVLFDTTDMIVEAYNSNEQYRKIVEEVLYELRDSLLIRRQMKF